MADVALVGFPNAGKSTLISTVSAAKPKIADYPFTTLEPHLGVVRVGGVHDGTEFVMADIPGLVEGAAGGKGLGHQFLRHIERARVLVVLLDLGAPDAGGEAPSEQLRVLLSELGSYRPELLERPRLVVGSKADVAGDGEGVCELVLSAATGAGVDDLVQRLGALIHEARAGAAAAVAGEVVVHRPASRGCRRPSRRRRCMGGPRPRRRAGGRLLGPQRRRRAGRGGAPAAPSRRRPRPGPRRGARRRRGHGRHHDLHLGGRRVIAVVKVGSSSVTADTVARLSGELAAARAAGHTVVVVTSGAIAAGWAALDRGEQRPSDPAVLQAVSAVGQHRLMRLWQDGLEPHGVLAGQVLLAPLDFVHRTQYLHARGTLRHLVDLGVVPVVNENDAVADEEIRFGDNDRLAALVAHLVGAQLLVLLTDAPGLLTADPRRDAAASLIEEVVEIDHQLERLAGGPGSAVGQRRHGVEARGGQDRHLVGRRGGDRGRGTARCARRRAGGRGRRRHRVPRPRAPAVGAQAVDRLRARRGRGPHRRRGRTGRAEREGALTARSGGHRGERWLRSCKTPSRSPGPTGRSSPRAWSACLRYARRSGWAGAARSSSIETTWCL